MAVKEDLGKDLLSVIAYGTPSARPPAANLLFYYWPSLAPTVYDLKVSFRKIKDNINAVNMNCKDGRKYGLFGLRTGMLGPTDRKLMPNVECM